MGAQGYDSGLTRGLTTLECIGSYFLHKIIEFTEIIRISCSMNLVYWSTETNTASLHVQQFNCAILFAFILSHSNR